MLTINGFIFLNIIASCHFGKNPDDINLLLNVNNFAQFLLFRFSLAK